MLSQLARAGRRPAGTLTHQSRCIPSQNPAQRLEVKSRPGGSSKVRRSGRSGALRAGGRQRARPRVGAGEKPDRRVWPAAAGGHSARPLPAGGRAQGCCPGKPRPPLPHCHIPQRVSSAVPRPRAFYGQTTLPGRGFFRELGGSAGARQLLRLSLVLPAGKPGQPSSPAPTAAATAGAALPAPPEVSLFARFGDKALAFSRGWRGGCGFPAAASRTALRLGRSPSLLGAGSGGGGAWPSTKKIRFVCVRVCGDFFSLPVAWRWTRRSRTAREKEGVLLPGSARDKLSFV